MAKSNKKKELENLNNYRDDLSYHLDKNWTRQVQLQVDKNETLRARTEYIFTAIMFGLIALALIGFFVFCSYHRISGCWILMVLAVVPVLVSGLACANLFDSRKEIEMMDVEASDLRSKEKVMLAEYRVVSDKISDLEKEAEKKNGKRTKTTKTTNK